jgi:hypothetical protein
LLAAFLATDPGETIDLAATQPGKMQELQTQWNAWNATLVQPLWGGGKSDFDGAEPGTPDRGPAAKPNLRKARLK